MVWEYIEGINLHELLGEGPLLPAMRHASPFRRCKVSTPFTAPASSTATSAETHDHAR